jgi:dTDP-4-dehydrorhamnose reductase
MKLLVTGATGQVGWELLASAAHAAGSAVGCVVAPSHRSRRRLCRKINRP